MSRLAIAQRARLAQLAKTSQLRGPEAAASPGPLDMVRRNPDAVETDHRGSPTWTPRTPMFLMWDKWDGRPWKTLDMAYGFIRNNPYDAHSREQRRLLQAAELRIKNSAHVHDLDLFIRDTRRHYYKLWLRYERFLHYDIEMTFILKLIKSSPPHVFHHLSNPWLKLSTTRYETEQMLWSIVGSFRTGDPLNIQARATWDRLKRDILRKNYDMSCASHTWRLHHKQQHLLSGEGLASQLWTMTNDRNPEYVQIQKDYSRIKNAYSRNLQRLLDQEPRLWAVEGFSLALKKSIDTFIRTIKKEFRRFEKLSFLHSSQGPERTELTERIAITLLKSMKNVVEMKHLGQEVAWIRYYRMHKYPHMDNESEISLGRAIYRYMLDVTDANTRMNILEVRRMRGPLGTLSNRDARYAMFSAFWHTKANDERQAKSYRK